MKKFGLLFLIVALSLGTWHFSSANEEKEIFISVAKNVEGEINTITFSKEEGNLENAKVTLSTTNAINSNIFFFNEQEESLKDGTTIKTMSAIFIPEEDKEKFEAMTQEEKIAYAKENSDGKIHFSTSLAIADEEIKIKINDEE